MTLGLLAGELLQQGIVVPGVAPTPDTGSFFLRPTSDEFNSSWQGDGGTLWSQIDEIIPDDSGSAISASRPIPLSNQRFGVFLDNSNGIAPSETIGNGVRISVRSKGSGILAIQLYSGSFAIENLVRTLIWIEGTGIWLTIKFGLSEAEIAAMGNWQGALLSISANSFHQQQISQAEIEFVSGGFDPTA